MFTIGIDLGTTYSVGAIFRPKEDRKLVTIPTSGYGSTQEHTLRSAVYFNPKSGAVEIGIGALDKSPSQVIDDSKRYVGLCKTHPGVQSLVNTSSSACKPIATDTGVSYNVQWAGESKTIIPEQVGAFILGMLKYRAEHKFESLGSVTGAVVTVPAYFTEQQKGATLTAAKIAGLDVLRILTEPTAAAIHWIMMDEGRNITLSAPLIVLDIGGGTTDISILHIEDKDDGSKVFQVLGTAGDQFLGGHNVNDIIYSSVAVYYEGMTGKVLDPTSDESKQLRKDIERKKTDELSGGNDVEFAVKGLTTPCPYAYQDFERSMERIIERTFNPLHNLLDELSQKKKTFPDTIPCEFNKDLPFVILLTGGGSRLDMFYERIVRCFPKCIRKKHHEPDVACAYGAAILAHKLSGAPNAHNIVVEDVTPMNIGISAYATVDGPDGVKKRRLEVTTVIKKFTKFGSPAVEKHFSTVKGCGSVAINIYEGDLPAPEQNTLISNFVIDAIPTDPLPLVVTMIINMNGVLEVGAELIYSDKKQNSIIVKQKECEEGELSRMITEYENSKTNQQINLEKRLAVDKLMELFKDKQEQLKSACITRPECVEEFNKMCVELTPISMIQKSRSFFVDTTNKVNKLFQDATSLADDNGDENSVGGIQSTK